MIVVVYAPQIGNESDYERLWQLLNSSANFPPPGCLLHVSYDLEDGRIGFTEVWESREQWETAMLEVYPALRENGGDIGIPHFYRLFKYFAVEGAIESGDDPPVEP